MTLRPAPVTRLAAAAMLAVLPLAAWAAGLPEPPAPVPTAQACPEGEIWDEEAEACVPIRDSRLDRPARMEAARSLAHRGRPADAAALLAGLGGADALTLRGYATRKAGDWAGGVALYRAALALDPDNWQARSYLGMGLLERGDRDGARAALDAIRASGGRGTWAETALADALATGRTGDY